MQLACTGGYHDLMTGHLGCHIRELMVRIDHARPSRQGFSEIRFGLWGYVQGI